LGRKAADYEEVGGVKDNKYVGMMYWNWHVNADSLGVQIPSQIIAQYPEAKDDYFNKAWQVKKSFWNEPLFGFYSSWDYWVYRKHAELLANAGVDVVFLDYSNVDNCFANSLSVMFQAFRDSREAGINSPKICYMTSWSTDVNYRRNCLKYLYLTYYKEGKYSDLWFYLEGKPLLFGGSVASELNPLCLNDNDKEEAALMAEISEFFTYRGVGSRKTGPTEGKKQWLWLDRYPQYEWGGKDENGVTECVSVGVAVNYSYVLKDSIGAGVFSDPYSEGRAYTEAFGEDYRKEAAKEGWFFREEASRALDISPKMVLIDGWNEWATGRQESYNGFHNAFVDTFDDENSRDIEPTRGALGDDYYNLLVDFVRKFKGVRPAQAASEPVTINIEGDLGGWDNVGPNYIADFGNYERDTDGYQPYHYKTTVNNAISGAKVARDNNNFYFYVKTVEKIVTDTPGWMNLYINTDRNNATGFEGYDYVLNREKAGVLEKSTGGYTFEKVCDVKYVVKDNVLQVIIPRSAINALGKADLEFKWTDGIAVNGDILNFYTDGSSAPSGRFAYLYTEIPQTAVTAEQRKDLEDTSIFKAGSNKMMVEGGKMYIYEPDTRIKAFEKNGTLYIPSEALNDVMGYGRTKIEWDKERSMIKIKNSKLSGKDISVTWAYTVANSYDVKVNGQLSHLTNPVIISDGLFYVPVTILSDCFGYTLYNAGNGYYGVSKGALDKDAVNAVLSHIG
ncbi:MAG: stalk domain-containing protein, partial [Bacillota bacterium]|nr:stalk domain-containing protein [Bacillota bacterium]